MNFKISIKKRRNLKYLISKKKIRIFEIKIEEHTKIEEKIEKENHN